VKQSSRSGRRRRRRPRRGIVTAAELSIAAVRGYTRASMRRPLTPTAESPLRAAWLGGLLAVTWACTPDPAWPEAESTAASQTTAFQADFVSSEGAARHAENSLGPFSTSTYSPEPDAQSWVLPGCVSHDERLSEVARQIAAHALTGEPPEPLGEMLRQAGVPQVWPRGFTLMSGPDEPAPVAAAEAWLRSVPQTGAWRCGVAVSTGGQPQRKILSVVAVEALADLEPFPRQARVGQWLPVVARLAQPALSARVLVAGPDEAVYALPHSVQGDRLSAQFVAREPGIFHIQVLPDFGAGPRPALEITTFVEVSAPAPEQRRPSRRVQPSPAEAAELFAALNDARARAKLSPLLLDSALTQLAQAHATQMARTETLAHDAGDGPPTQRVGAAELRLQWVGENVAQAMDAEGAHATLWASPAHRANLLHPRFTWVGIGAQPARDGRSIWFCQLFAGGADTAAPEAPGTY
jgi:uncharacterized protein YkwD